MLDSTLKHKYQFKQKQYWFQKGRILSKYEKVD